MAIFQCSTKFLGICQRFFINSHNAQFHCIKGKWHDRRHLSFLSFLFLSDHQTRNFVTRKTHKIKHPLTQEAHQHRTSLACLHFAQIDTLSKTLQSWCRALKVFYQTSLLPLCNVFCHVYERSLKLLEINNISSVSKHELKSSDKFFHFHLQMGVY